LAQPQRQRELKTSLFDCAAERSLDLTKPVMHSVSTTSACRTSVRWALAVREVRLQCVQQQLCPTLNPFNRTEVAFDEPIDPLKILTEEQDQRLHTLTSSNYGAKVMRCRDSRMASM
jgi:ABC-type cobalamin transport system ATPase subunit